LHFEVELWSRLCVVRNNYHDNIVWSHHFRTCSIWLFPKPTTNKLHFFFLNVLSMLKSFWRSFYHLKKNCLYFWKAVKLALHHIHSRNSIPFTLSSEGFAFVSKHCGKIRIKTITKVEKTQKKSGRHEG